MCYHCYKCHMCYMCYMCYLCYMCHMCYYTIYNIDDIFILFRGSLDTLHAFLEDLNTIHPTIKFTMTHTVPYLKENNFTACSCDLSSSLAFLDTSCQISGGQIIVDLYRKPTDRNQYLLTSSCHPAHVTTNIPFSLALRIVRICSLPADRDKRLAELKKMLLERDYKPGLIDAVIEKAKAIPRSEALKKVENKKDNKRPVFVITYDPRLPSITNIVHKHWRTMTKDPYLKQVFEAPPLIAYRRPKNLKELTIRAKVPPLAPSRPKRKIPGMTKCNRCPTCLGILVSMLFMDQFPFSPLIVMTRRHQSALLDTPSSATTDAVKNRTNRGKERARLP